MVSENASIVDNQQERLSVSHEDLNFYISGFVDGEGCFSVTVCRSNFRKLRWNINPFFQVYQHKDNTYVLNVIKEVFECGYISKKGGNPLCNVYCVDKISDLIGIVIPFFDEYKLFGNKYLDFQLFKQIVTGIKNQEHLNPDGFIRLARLAFLMNSKGKHRKNKLEDIFREIKESSEAKR